MPPPLDALRSAVETTAAVLDRWRDEAHLAGLDRATRLGLRAGLVKHFEFTYELSWKLMRRWVRDFHGASGEALHTRHDVFRLAGDAGLIPDVERWMAHHRARNLTSHTYEEATARRVLAAIPAFLEDCRNLVARLESRRG